MRVATWYLVTVAILIPDRDWKHNGKVSDDVKADLDELEALAKTVLRHQAAADKARDEIRAKLPEVRKKGIGPADLERAIHSVFVQGSISRWTKHVAPAGGKGRPLGSGKPAADA